MSKVNPIPVAGPLALMIAASAALAQSAQPDPAPSVPPPMAARMKIDRPKVPAFVPPTLSAVEPVGQPQPNAGDSTFTASPLADPAIALTLPQTLTYSGASVAFSLTDTGTNKAIKALILNSSNPNSAVYGQTNGNAAGVSGYNMGTSGVSRRQA